MSTKNDQDAPLDLNDAIDSLLTEIEATTRQYAPEEEPAIDANTLLTDDGTVATAPEPVAEPESTDSDSESSTDSETIDSIENAQQALDALDEVESQAQDLVAQSIDALLEDAEDETDAEVESEVAAEPAAEPEVVVESEAIVETEAEVESEATESDDDADLLLDSIDGLLADTDLENVEEEDQSQIDDTVAVPEEDAPDPEPTDEAAETITVDEDVVEELTEDSVEDVIEDIDEIADPEPISAPVAEPVAEISEEELVVESLDASSDALDDSMDMLDSALSEAADDMLDGDFETEEGELVTGEAVASAIEEALENQPKPDTDEDLLGDAADDLLGEDEPAPGSNAAEPISEPVVEPTTEPTPELATEKTEDQITEKSPEPKAKPAPKPEPVAAALDTESKDEIEALEETHAKKPTPVPAWFERVVEIIRPKIDKIDPLKGKTIDALAMVLGTVIVAVMTHATPIIARIMILISKPLAKQSPEIRNAVGYIALWTGFLATVLWVYLLMFRSPVIPHPEAAPTRVISADESVIIQPVIEILP